MLASGTSRLLVVLVVAIIVGTAWHPAQRLVALNSTLADAKVKLAKWSENVSKEHRYLPDPNACAEFTFGGGYRGSPLDQEYEHRRCMELTAELDAMIAEQETPEYWIGRIEELQTMLKNEVLSWLRLAGMLSTAAILLVLLVRWIALGFLKNGNAE